METIRVRINDDGVTAKECNPFGNIQEQEYLLRTFTIVPNFEYANQSVENQNRDNPIVGYRQEKWIPGSIHTASILPNGKIKILD